ncbi:MAG: hypothetical protein K6E54_10600 [Bacteroidaceae bacterium]|nr:hypothetical protein [Bacteroidaceae bacterium]
MKKLLFFLLTIVSFTNAKAFKFDGIDLNGTQQQVAREISMKGYVYDDATKSLKGNCHGMNIFLSLDQDNVSDKSKIGRLIVDIPMTTENAIEDAVVIFNVIYHRIASISGNATYSVDDDGTIMELKKTQKGIQLIYVTPNYNAKN